MANWYSGVLKCVYAEIFSPQLLLTVLVVLESGDTDTLLSMEFYQSLGYH